MSGSPSKITPADYEVVRSLATTQAVAERFGVSLSTAHKHRQRAVVVAPVAVPQPADSAVGASVEGAGALGYQHRPKRPSPGGTSGQQLPRGGADLAPRVRRQLAGQFIRGDSLSALLDANDYASNLRAERIRERGLHPVQATNWQVDCDDDEWRNYLASRDTWPPHVDPEKATRRWRLGAAIK